MNVTSILAGPANVAYNGATFSTKGDIVLTHEHETFDVEVSRFGKVDQRVSNSKLTLKFTPAGEWEDLAVLFPYASTLLGSLIAPLSLDVESIDLDTEVLQITGHGIPTATPVMLSADVSLPTTSPQVDSLTLYYARAVSSSTISLHPTADDATNNTAKITISEAGTGTLRVSRELPLVIHTVHGVKITLRNAALTKMPELELSATKTLLGEVEFEAFLGLGAASGADSGSRWAVASAAFSDTTFDPANVITQPYTLAWGASAPWASFQTKSGTKIAFNLDLTAVETDTLGVVSRRLSGLTVEATAAPMGITENDLLTAIALQGSGYARGKSLSGDDLVVAGTGVHVTVYGAALRTGSQAFGFQSDRIGDLTWFATRTFSVGVPNPLFRVGTAAP